MDHFISDPCVPNPCEGFADRKCVYNEEIKNVYCQFVEEATVNASISEMKPEKQQSKELDKIDLKPRKLTKKELHELWHKQKMKSNKNH